MRTRPNHALTAALVAGLLVLAGCGGGDDSTADPSDEPTATEPTDSDEPSESELPADEPSTPTDDAPTVEAVPEGQELLLRDADGEVEVIYTLDPTGESFFVSAAARPGSTSDDATIVTITQAEGMYDLRWLEIIDGDVGELAVADSPYRPASEMTPVDGIGPAVAWSPGGGSVGWIEWNAAGDTTLRTFGWSDGPGTGADATDNAAFGVEPIPAGSRIMAWTATDGAMSRIDVSGPDGSPWTITIERQGDGALALPPDAVQEG